MAFLHTYKTKTGTETRILSPVRACRIKCLDCTCWQPKEIELCKIPDCACYPFRFGKDPGNTRKMSDEQKKAGAERLQKARSARAA
jgi:hypothetical protein